MYSNYFYIGGLALSGGITYTIITKFCINRNTQIYASCDEQFNIFNYGFFVGMGLGASTVYLNSKLLKSSD